MCFTYLPLLLASFFFLFYIHVHSCFFCKGVGYTQTVMNSHVGEGNWTWVMEEQPVLLNTWTISPALLLTSLNNQNLMAQIRRLTYIQCKTKTIYSDLASDSFGFPLFRVGVFACAYRGQRSTFGFISFPLPCRFWRLSSSGLTTSTLNCWAISLAGFFFLCLRI